jgi:hypothetical protein
MLDALDYVADVTGLQAPAEARAGLRRTPVPMAVRLRRRRRIDVDDGGAGPPSRWDGLADAYEEDAAGSVVPGARTGLPDATRFLARRWGLDRASAVPAHALWVAAGRPWALRRTGRRLRGVPRTAPDARIPRYTLGTLLRFDAEGGGFLYLGAGWWYPEPHGTWSRGHVAQLTLPLWDAVTADLRLDLVLHAPITPRNPSVAMTVVVNDVVVGRHRLSRPLGDAENVTLMVPARALAGWNRAEVAFVVERSLAPADTRLSTDLRQLGLGLIGLRLSPTTERNLKGQTP